MQVEDFLYKIKKLAKYEEVSEKELLQNIHHLLKEEVYDWWFTREDRFSIWGKFEKIRFQNGNRDRGIKAQICELKHWFELNWLNWYGKICALTTDQNDQLWKLKI